MGPEFQRVPWHFGGQDLRGRDVNGWEDGDMVSYGQVDWGGDPATNAAAANVVANFGAVYPFSSVEIGTSGLPGFSIIFTSAAAIIAYLPQGGAPGALTADLVDPTSTSAGALAGAVLALRLNIDFADAGLLPNASGLLYGDLRLCGLPQTALNNITIRDFLAVLNATFGGGGAGLYGYDELFLLAETIGRAFTGGVPSQFAQTYLRGVACPNTWEEGDVISHIQADRDDPLHAAGILLGTYFNLVYFPVGGTDHRIGVGR